MRLLFNHEYVNKKYEWLDGLMQIQVFGLNFDDFECGDASFDSI